MEPQFEGKKVPWSQIEKYVEIHETDIQPLLTFIKANPKLMTTAYIES